MPEFKSREEYEKWKAEKMRSASNQKETSINQPRMEEGRDSSKEGFNFCPGCGKELIQADKFCPHCGRSLEPAERESRHMGLDDDISEDFLAFIGENAPKYVQKFRKFRIGGADNFAVTWHWPAFLAGGWWML